MIKKIFLAIDDEDEETVSKVTIDEFRTLVN
jgi:hypothetical protein